MTAEKIIEALEALRDGGRKDFSSLFLFLSGQVAEARLRNGSRLTDATDVIVWFRELSTAAQGGSQRATRSPNYDTCPRCGHVHQDEDECGEEIGGGRKCRCELTQFHSKAIAI